MYTYKVVIHPNNKQATKLKLIMNKCIECQNIVYDYLDNLVKLNKQYKEQTGEYRKFPSCGEVREWFTIQKKIEDEKIIKARQNLTNKEQRENHLNFLFRDCTNDALKQTVKDTYSSFIRFFKKISKYPVKKTYNDSHKSFYMDPYKIEFTENKVKLEKIANNTKQNRTVLNWIKLAEKNRIPTDCKYYNPRISFDGYRFYLTVAVDDMYAPTKYKVKKEKLNKTNESIGVDVNINNIDTSNTDATITKEIETINNTKKVKRLEKRIIKQQKSLSRKYHLSKEINKKFIKSHNYMKNKYRLHKLRSKLQNIRESYLNDTINKIVFIKNNTIPYRIVIEDLDVKEMLNTTDEVKKKENKHLRPLIQKVAFSKILTKIKEKCLFYDIKLVIANQYFPSSKTCSCCHYIKNNLKLSDRIYKCDNCGLIIKRDLNAAINLARY